MRLSSTEEDLLNKLRTLPPDLVPLIGGLVDFLVRAESDRRAREQREREEQRTQAAQLEGPLGRVWDNADDAAYDRL